MLLLRAKVPWRQHSSGAGTEPRADCRAATGSGTTATAGDDPFFASHRLPCSLWCCLHKEHRYHSTGCASAHTVLGDRQDWEKNMILNYWCFTFWCASYWSLLLDNIHRQNLFHLFDFSVSTCRTQAIKTKLAGCFIENIRSSWNNHLGPDLFGQMG